MKRAFIAAAGIAACIHVSGVPAGAEPITQVYMFGDSSADVGTDGFRYCNLGNMWIETVGKFLGFPSTPARLLQAGDDGSIDLATTTITPNGGNNYAVGGATAVPYSGVVNFANQIAFFQQDHSSIDKNALVFIWMGSNDPAEAVLRGDIYDPLVYVDAYMKNVQSLQAMGARNIVAMAEPVNLIPEGLLTDLGFPQELIDQHKENIAASNSALWPELQKAGVYVVDVDKLGNDVISHLGKYGFTVGTEGYMTADDPRELPNDGHVFANNHYSSAMHDVIADYTLAQLRARDQFVAVVTQPLITVQQEMADLDPHMRADSFFQTGVAGQKLRRETGVWQPFADYAIDSSRQSSSGGTDEELNGLGTGIELGTDTLITDHMLIGGQVSYAYDHAGFGNDTGGFSRNTIAATLYAAAQVRELGYINLALNLGLLDYGSIKREASLGIAQESAKGDTIGYSATMRVGAGYDIVIQDWTVTPNTSLTFGNSTIRGYEEDKSVLSVAYGDSTYAILRGSLGVRAALTGGGGRLRPYVAIALDRDLNTEEVTVEVGPERGMLVEYAADRPYQTMVSSVLGASYTVNRTIALNSALFLNRSLGDDETTDFGGWIGLKVSF
jgi:outer membrane autotransporter protein